MLGWARAKPDSRDWGLCGARCKDARSVRLSVRLSVGHIFATLPTQQAGSASVLDPQLYIHILGYEEKQKYRAPCVLFVQKLDRYVRTFGPRALYIRLVLMRFPLCSVETMAKTSSASCLWCLIWTMETLSQTETKIRLKMTKRVWLEFFQDYSMTWDQHRGLSCNTQVSYFSDHEAQQVKTLMIHWQNFFQKWFSDSPKKAWRQLP